MRTALPLLGQARTQFTGRNDYYATLAARSAVGGTIDQAIAGIRPYDVVQGLISDAFAEDATARLQTYRNAWNFYNGDHFDNPYDDGELKVVANYCKKIVDSAVDWFVADGWSTVCKSGNEQVAEALDLVWEANNKQWVTESMCQYGAITGDSFLYVTVQTKDVEGKKLPRDQWAIRLSPLNPSHCFPFWNPFVPGEMQAMLIQYPYPGEDDSSETVLLSLLITPQKWTLWRNDNKIDEQSNPFGAINVVHVPNFIKADQNFGQSDIHHVIPLNEEFNLMMNKIRKIISYHAEPTTIVTGCKVGDMTKGARKVWSGLPPEAKVTNLQLDADLGATYSYLDRLENIIAQFSNTPKILFESSGVKISNTSGLAMQMMFQPIIEKTKKRRITFTAGLQKANSLIVSALEKILRVDVGVLADDPESRNVCNVHYTSPLPRDEQAELDAAMKKIEIGAWSKAEAIRRISGVSDFERLVIEISADERYKLAHAKELQVATQGRDPNLSVVFLNSSVLSEDLVGLSKKMPEVDSMKKNGSSS